MKIKLLEKDKGKLAVLVSETTPAYMNTLRRLMMNSVPALAVEHVEFRKNSSILYDEIIAHRLGLVPLTTDLKSYNLPEECKCKGKGCAQCSLKLTLKGKSDKGTTTIYSKDMKSKDPKIKAVYPDIPIVRIKEGQEIECEMTAILGVGKEHGKWSPCLVWFKHYPHVKITKQPGNAKELAEKYPPVLELKSGKLSVNEKNLIHHDILDKEIETASGGSIKYEEKDEYVLFIEPWGQLEAKQILEKAIEIHNKELKEFAKLLKNI